MSTHFITLAKAIELTQEFRSNKENVLLAEHRNTGLLPICETFSRDAIDALLAENDCQSLRIYFGMTSELKVNLVLVGVDSAGRDLLPGSGSTEPDNNIVEDGIRCPTTCPPSSPLNED
jgi:hypothetical protein